MSPTPDGWKRKQIVSVLLTYYYASEAADGVFTKRFGRYWDAVDHATELMRDPTVTRVLITLDTTERYDRA